MRSMRLLAALTGALVLGSACGDDGPTGSNTPPVANFTAPSCTAGVACTFTDASTDDNAVTGWDWDFGDATPHATTEDPAHTYAAAGTYNVVLTVTDAAGLTGTRTVAVTVAAPAALAASFTFTCDAGDCAFTNTSTGPVASYLWDFGDPTSGALNTSNLEDPTHAFAVTSVTDFTVTLTVSDNAAGTDVETQTVSVSPPAGLTCAGVDCTLDLTSPATVTVTVTAVDCQFTGNAFAITAPIQETVFTDGCSLAPNTVFNINGGAAFPDNTSLEAQFTQGAGGPNDPPKGPPATRVTGTFPEWTVEFDDGGDPTGVGEPDFNDIVLTVRATP
jgi:PKD repeat protein